LADFKNSFTVGLSIKFATGLMSYFPPRLKCVTTLPCEIQKFNNSNAINHILITHLLLNVSIMCAPESHQMLKMPSFSMNIGLYPETFVPFIHCVIDDILSQAMPDLRQMLLQFIDFMNLTSVANVSLHASMPNNDILAFHVTQEYTHN